MDSQASFEALDDTDELGQWTQVKDSLVVLESYYNEIAQQGAISRDQAKALVGECGVQLGQSYPLESFTQLPSRTNFNVALEGVLEETARLLWTLIKKAAVLLLKVIRWLIEMYKQHRDRVRAAQRNLHTTTVVGEVNSDLRAAGLASALANSEAVEDVIAAKQLSDDAVEAYEQLFTELVQDIVLSESSGFTVGVRNIGVEVFELAELVADKLKLFDQVITAPSVVSTASSNVIMLSELRTIATAIPTQRLGATMAAHGMRLPTSSTFAAAMLQIQDRFSQLRNTPTEDVIEPASALQRVTMNGSKATAPFSLKPERDMETLQEIEKHLAKMQSITPSDVASPEIRQAFAEAINCVTSEVQALRTFTMVFRGCEAIRDQFFDTLFKVEIQQFMTYREVAKVSQDPNIVKAVNAAQDVLKDKLHR